MIKGLLIGGVVIVIGALMLGCFTAGQFLYAVWRLTV